MRAKIYFLTFRDFRIAWFNPNPSRDPIVIFIFLFFFIWLDDPHLYIQAQCTRHKYGGLFVTLLYTLILKTSETFAVIRSSNRSPNFKSNSILRSKFDLQIEARSSNRSSIFKSKLDLQIEVRSLNRSSIFKSNSILRSKLNLQIEVYMLVVFCHFRGYIINNGSSSFKYEKVSPVIHY